MPHHGFLRVAARAQAPILPVASIGADDVFHLVGDAFDRGRRWFGVPVPIPRPSFGIPWPHLAALKYVFGEPIPPPPADADDATLHRVRREVGGAIHELIDAELARRAFAHS